MAVEIRRATRQDIAAITGLIRELGSTVGELYESLPRVDPERWNATLRVMLGSADWFFLLACDAEDEVGLLVFHIAPTLFHGGNTALITELVVKEERRAAGIGQMLVGEARSIARESGCRELAVTMEADNEDAARFYRYVGFNREFRYLQMDL